MPRKKPRRLGSYEVGYGKPPVASQFKPGQSGNRKGRPRKERQGFREIAPGVGQIHRTVLLSCLTPFDDPGGEWFPSTNLGRIVDGIVERAASGDPRCARLVLELLADATQAEAVHSEKRMNEVMLRFVKFMYTEKRLGAFRSLSDGRVGFGVADGTDEAGEDGLEVLGVAP